MDTKLKLKDIVRRSRLDRQQAKYVLMRTDVLTGMPESESKGDHREFSLRQAVRLAICTQLFANGRKMEEAVAILNFCEKRVRQLGFSPKNERLYNVSPKDPWLLVISDASLIRVWRNGVETEFADEDEYFDFKKGMEKCFSIGDDLVRTTIDLTQIESRLANLTR